jgi:hypothetical protein
MMWMGFACALAVGLGVGLIISRQRATRRGSDLDATKVDAFRRHMEALSPEARRGVIDRVRAARDGDTLDRREG